MGILLCEQNFRDVWRRNKSVRGEIGKILRTHKHTHAAKLVVRFVLIALSRCNRVFTRRLRLCHSHTVYRREVRKGDREGPNRLESEV